MKTNGHEKQWTRENNGNEKTMETRKQCIRENNGAAELATTLVFSCCDCFRAVVLGRPDPKNRKHFALNFYRYIDKRSVFQCGGGHLCGRPSRSLACGDGHGMPEARLGVGTAARGARGLSAGAGPAAFAATRSPATQCSPGGG